MNRKITLILALLILAAISVSVVTAFNDTSDSIAADEDAGEILANDDNGGLTVKKVWDDNNNAAGKRPSSIKFTIFENDDKIEEGCEITESMGWQATLDFAIYADSTYKIVEEDVPDGYTATVTGNAKDGFVITNTLKETAKNETDKNSTNSTNPKTPEKKDPTNEKKVVKKTTTKKVTTKESNKQPKKEAKKDKHKTGNPILLGALAVSLAGLAYNFKRKE